MPKTFYFEFATVERIIDADTLKITCDTGFGNTHSDTFRLAGINAPEMNTPEGKAAKEFVVTALGKLPADVSIICLGKDKYGRWLADVKITSLGHVNLNKQLIELGHAVSSKG